MTIKIEEKKIRKMGEYHYVSIPKALIDTDVLSTEKKYTLILEESNPKKSTKKNHKSNSNTQEIPA
jgi:hypothetical protein